MQDDAQPTKAASHHIFPIHHATRATNDNSMFQVKTINQTALYIKLLSLLTSFSDYGLVSCTKNENQRKSSIIDSHNVLVEGTCTNGQIA